MPLRIGFDVDGVVANFAAAFRDVEARLFGAESPPPPDGALDEEVSREAAGPAEIRRRREAVWAAIRATPDFWTTLTPSAPDAIPRIDRLSRRYGWDVFFITQRPATAGESVQRQTQRWLAEQGLDLPCVIPTAGSRGTLGAALRLDYHVDDSVQHCLDVKADSKASPILITAHGRTGALISTRRLGVAVASGIHEALDILEEASQGDANPSLLQRLASMVGWT